MSIVGNSAVRAVQHLPVPFPLARAIGIAVVVVEDGGVMHDYVHYKRLDESYMI